MSSRGMSATRRRRADEVVRLRHEGHTYAEIAEQVGVSATRCKDDFRQAMEQARPDVARRVHVELTADYERLRVLAMRAAESGDPAAIRDAATVLEREARFHGLIGAATRDVAVGSAAMVTAEIASAFQTILDTPTAELMDGGDYG